MSLREKNRLYYKAYMRDIRIKALRVTANGGPVCCMRCGFSDMRALQFDHIDSDGSKHRKIKHAICLYLDIVRKRNSVPVQILCANCNWIKRHENNEITGRPRIYKDEQALLFNEEDNQ